MGMTPGQQRLYNALKRGPVWVNNEQGYAANVPTLRAQISRLRMCIDGDIKCIRGVGYTLSNIDPETGRPYGDIGTAQDAIDYAIMRGDMLFLANWNDGSACPHYLSWLKDNDR